MGEGRPMEKWMGNLGLFSAGPLIGPDNTPAQLTGRQHPYYEGETALFRERYDQYATDFFEARVQGLDPEDFFAWSWQMIRLADLTDLTATATQLADSVKNVLFQNSRIQYVPRGAKLETAGSTWLITNPQSISGTSAVGTAERCAAVWHYLDFYGNVKGEPIVVAGQLARATASDPQDIMLITKQYFNVKCQYNEATAQLNTNSRMILGSGAYAITGYADFLREFTTDAESVRMLEFTLRYEEPNLTIDDMERQVAGGKTFSWEVDISGPRELTAGQRADYTAASLRCGEPVASTEEQPITYTWASSDESVVQIDPESGGVTAVAPGTCSITATLEQNPSQSASLQLTVAEGAAGGEYAAFVGQVPDTLEAYQSVALEAACFRDGAVLEGEQVTWSFAGADRKAYSAVVQGNRAELSCWGGSVTPLRVTVLCGTGGSSTAEIRLEGI